MAAPLMFSDGQTAGTIADLVSLVADKLRSQEAQDWFRSGRLTEWLEAAGEGELAAWAETCATRAARKVQRHELWRQRGVAPPPNYVRDAWDFGWRDCLEVLDPNGLPRLWQNLRALAEVFVGSLLGGGVLFLLTWYCWGQTRLENPYSAGLTLFALCFGGLTVCFGGLTVVCALGVGWSLLSAPWELRKLLRHRRIWQPRRSDVRAS